MKVALLVSFASILHVGAVSVPDDFWFVADFDSTPELCGNAFLRALPDGDGVNKAGYTEGRFGRGYAFLGPTNRCEGMFWRERRPEALSDFPWTNGTFACWYRTPEGVASNAPARAFAVGNYQWCGDRFKTFKDSGGWLGLPASVKTRSTSWHHLAVVWAGGRQAAYLDGVEVACKTRNAVADPFAKGDFDFQLGTGGYASPAANLVLDEVAVFRHGLSAAEVRALATAKGPLRAGKSRLAATPVGLAVFYRNEPNAALRMRLVAPEAKTYRLAGTVGGRPLAGRKVKVPKGESAFDVQFEVRNLACGEHDWSFCLTDDRGQVALARSGRLVVCPRLDRKAFKVLSWGGGRELTGAYLRSIGVNASNVHPGQYNIQRDLATNGVHLSGRVVNWRAYVPLDLDARAIRSGVRAKFDHLRNFHGWDLSLMNTEMYGTGTAPIWHAAESPSWRRWAEKCLPHGLPETNRFTRAPAQVNWKACGRTPPSGVLGDKEPEIEALVWYYRTGHLLYRGNRPAMDEVKELSPGNVCWAEPIIEAWNIAEHHDQICDWLYNYRSANTLACVRGQEAWVRPTGKPYMPLVSMAYEHDKNFNGVRDKSRKDARGKPIWIYPSTTADDLAIRCWLAIGAVKTHDFGFFSIDTWLQGVETWQTSGGDLMKVNGPVATPGDPEKFATFFKSKFLPAAELLEDMPNARAPFAVLQPVESRYMGGWPVQCQTRDFCVLAGEWGVPYDVIPDGEVKGEVLSRYRYVVLPYTRVLTKAHNDLLTSLPKTTTIVVDGHCPSSLLPRAVRLKAKFDWRNWDTTARPAFSNWLASVQGELNARRDAWSDQDGEFKSQTFLKEYKGAKYVLVLNDLRRRLDCPQTRVITNAWYKPHGAPQRITTHLPVFKGGVTYEFAASPVENDAIVTRDYAPAEAKVFCLYPRKLAKPAMALKGEVVEIAINDIDGVPAPGRQIVEVTVTGPDGAVRDESGRIVVEDGRGHVPLCLSDSDLRTLRTGAWRIVARDLTTGLSAEGVLK